MSKYIGEATAYDKKLILERKEPLERGRSIVPQFRSSSSEFHVILPNLKCGRLYGRVESATVKWREWRHAV